ncbi:MAG: C4-type zinc ribbon domain-containing protein [Dehalococcoidia bacterium]
MTSSAELFALQEVDLALDKARASLADAEAGLGEDEELVEARQAAEERRDALRAAERAFKDHEFEADELRAKIEPLEKKLYAGGVHNPKELGDLQRDIESIRRHRSGLEDKALEAMEALDRAQEEAAEAERHLEEVGGEYAHEQEDLGGRKGRLEAEIARLEEERAEEAKNIDASMISLYEKLRVNHQGRAVAKILGGACQGCRISLPVNIIQRARGGAVLVQCTSCERILHVG